jgi:hypothetical protein
MPFTLLSTLLETPLTAGNVHQFAGKEVRNLTDRDEFKAIQQTAPDFAKKLVLAWEGDAREYDRNGGKGFDPLFPKMLEPKSIAKFAPGLKADQAISLLKQLFNYSFSTKQTTARSDNSVWAQERWAKESQNFDKAAYKLLREEVETVNESEAKKFPNTEAGVKAFMKDANEVDQNFTKLLKLDSCEFKRDPHVEGVWAIDSLKTGKRVIVYLAGYRDEYNDIRDYNDFEEGLIPKTELKRLLDYNKITQKQFDKFVAELDEY